MARTQQQAAGLPGFYSVSTGGHGFKNRHYYNPKTGEALSQRNAQDIRAGKYTLEEALVKNQTPIGTHMVQYKNGGTVKVTVFRHMSGAYGYASQSKHSSYFVVYGETRNPYEWEESIKGYRTISKLDSAASVKRQGLPHYWSQASSQVLIDGRTRYIVMERIL